MKMRVLTCGLLLLSVTARADPGFLKSLPADDFMAAGLQKLTPEELARLEALFQHYKTGELAEAQRQAEAKASASRLEAEARIVAAETKARDALAKAEAASLKAKETEKKVAAAPTKKSPGWFKALLTLKRASEKPEKEEPLESRLVGDFHGWSGHTIFNLEDGTRWVQQNRIETYICSPALHSPTVKVTPAAITGFWLEIKGINLSVRVIPLELPDQK